MANKRKKRRIKKKFLIFLVIILALILSLVIVKLCTSDDGFTYNKNENFVKTQRIEGIVFKNIKCTYDGKDSLVSYTMMNDTEKKIYLKNYDVIVKDKNNVRLTKIAINVKQTLPPKKSLKMANQVVGVDLTKAYYMELKLNMDNKKK